MLLVMWMVGMRSDSEFSLISSFRWFDQELPAEYLRRAKELEWRAGPVEAGDVILFDIRLVHASTANLSDCFRISMDTRWKPAELLDSDLRESFVTL